ncbi:hypothetical protein BJX99DRAFT_261823 [Aspergillus californicus]
MSALKLRLKDEEKVREDARDAADNQYSDWAAFQIFQRCLEDGGDLSELEAAKQLYRLILSRAKDELRTIKYPPGQTEYLAQLVIQIAQQIPYNHPSQNRLLKIVQYLMSSDRFLSFYGMHELPDKEFGSYHQWETLYSAIADGYIANADWKNPEQERWYINFHAFIVRFVAAMDNGKVHQLRWPIELLSDQLEKTLEKPESHLNTMVTSASLSVLYTGQWLFHKVTLYPPRLLAEQEPGFVPGELYNGAMFGMERWQYWKQALKAKADIPHLGDEARGLALKAVDFMDALERNCTW